MQAQVKASNFIGNVTLSKVEVDSLGIMNKMEFGVKKEQNGLIAAAKEVSTKQFNYC